jgi:hypothetical protein
MENKKIETKKQGSLPWLLGALILVMLIRVLPVLKSPLSTYGYDYGFYLYAIEHAKTFDIHSFTSAIFGGYNSPLFSLSNLLHIPVNISLNEFYFLSFIISALVCFYFFYPKNAKAGIITTVLCACSLSQSESYNLFLWKSAIAFPLLILALKFLKDRKFWPCLFFSALLLITHRTTALVYIATLVIYLLIKAFKQQKLKKLALLLGATILILPLILWPQIHKIFNFIFAGQNSLVEQGVFFQGYNFWLMLLPAAILGLAGFVLSIKRKENLLLIIFTSISFLWIIFTLPFYHRLAIYFDLGCLLLGAYFFAEIKIQTLWKNILTSVVIIGLLIVNIIFIINKNPLITPQEVEEIKTFNTAPGYVLAISAIDAP